MNNPVSEKSGEAPPSSSGSPQPKLEDRGHAAGAASPREALLNALSEEKKSPSPPPPLMSQPLLSGDAKPVILGGSAVDALRYVIGTALLASVSLFACGVVWELR
jgi:hypothetical protein